MDIVVMVEEDGIRGQLMHFFVTVRDLGSIEAERTTHCQRRGQWHGKCVGSGVGKTVGKGVGTGVGADGCGMGQTVGKSVGESVGEMPVQKRMQWRGQKHRQRHRQRCRRRRSGMCKSVGRGIVGAAVVGSTDSAYVRKIQGCHTVST